MKRFISLVTSIGLIAGSIAIPALTASAAYEDAEIFATDITFLKQTEYDMLEQNFTTISLKDVANNGYVDEVGGDDKGGWTDEGNKNDMRHFDLKGMVTLKGVPFDMVDPDTNNGKAVVTCAGRGATFVPTEVDIPIGKEAAGLYILHASAWNYGTGDKKGEYILVYEDGTSAKLELFENVNIHNFWGAADYATSQCVWKGNFPGDGHENAIGMIAVSNPYPEKKIEKLHVASMDGGAKSWLFVLGVTLTDSGPYLPDMGIVDLDNPSTGSWIQTTGVNKTAAGTALDASNLREMPAGKHGVLKSDKDNFVFEDGEKINFWGINLNYTADLEDKAKADEIFDDISKLGYNIVRMKTDVKSLTDTQADAIKYAVAKLKEKGIYSYLVLDDSADLNVFVKPELREAQKEGIKKLMATDNSYTGMPLAKDPAVAMVELMSDANLYYFMPLVQCPVDEAEIQKQFNEFLVEKYGTRAALKKAWDSESLITLNDGEDPTKGTVVLNKFWRNNVIYSDARNLDIRLFYDKVQMTYYSEMKSYLESIGYGAMATLNSNPEQYDIEQGEAYINSKTDFVARNSIFKYNTNGDNLEKAVYIPGTYSSNLYDNGMGVLGELTRFKYNDTPFVVSEWNTGWISKNHAEDYLAMAFIGAKQNWNPITYTYQSSEKIDENRMTGLYDVYNNPVSRAAAVGAARLFNAVDENSKSKVVNVSEKDVYFDGLHPWYGFLTDQQTLKLINEEKFANFFKNKVSYQVADKSSTIVVPTEDMYSIDDSKIDLVRGEMYIITDKAEAFACQNSANKNIDLKSITLNMDNPWYTAILTSSNNVSLKDDSSMLLTLAASVRNRGYSFTNNYINSGGKAPVIAQPVQGTVRIKLDGDYVIYALDEDGTRKSEVTSYKTTTGETVFKVNEYSYISDSRALNFEIVKKGD